MTPDQAGYDLAHEAASLRHDTTVVDLDWTASGYRRTQAFAARIPDELDVRALTQSHAVGMLRTAIEEQDATDDQIGRLARGIIRALTDLRLVAP